MTHTTSTTSCTPSGYQSSAAFARLRPLLSDAVDRDTLDHADQAIQQGQKVTVTISLDRAGMVVTVEVRK